MGGSRRRHAHPEIARAFGEFPPEEDKLPGQPTLDELTERSLSRLGSEGYSGTFDTLLRVKAIKGTTIEMSVTMIADDGAPVSVCSWRAGSGISFSLLRRLN